MYVCVCVCVCARARPRRGINGWIDRGCTRRRDGGWKQTEEKRGREKEEGKEGRQFIPFYGLVIFTGSPLALPLQQQQQQSPLGRSSESESEF